MRRSTINGRETEDRGWDPRSWTAMVALPVLLWILLTTAGAPRVALGSSAAALELDEDYWMAARWQEAEGETPEDVVIDWGISSSDLEGWEEASPSVFLGSLPYRKSGDRIWYEMDGEELALWDIETYVQNNLRWYAAVWRDSSQVSYLADGYSDHSDLLDTPPEPDAELVDFECYLNDDGELEYLGLWRKELEDGAELDVAETGSSPDLEFDELSFEGLTAFVTEGESPPRIVDLEQCGYEIGDSPDEAERFVVLYEPGAGSADVEVGRGPWEGEVGDDPTCENPNGEKPLVGLHPCYHSKEVHVVELESVPVSGDAVAVSVWEYVWIWEVVPEDEIEGGCEISGSKSDDWLMLTDTWRWLEREVACRAEERDGGETLESGQATRGQEDECGLKCHEVLQLVDLIIGADEMNLSDEDSPQHRPTHGDGAGGPDV